MSTTFNDLERKAITFFDLVRSENIPLDDIYILHSGIGGEEAAQGLRKCNEFFLEYKIEGESRLEYKGEQIVGVNNILDFLEIRRDTESSHSSSLLKLIEI